MLIIHGNFVWNTLSQTQINHSESNDTIDDDSTNSGVITADWNMWQFNLSMTEPAVIPQIVRIANCL